jgi:hypothetical protein
MPDTRGDGPRKVYTTPRLTVHGTLEEITTQRPQKAFGPGDGMTFWAPPVLTNVS